jgi:nicotinamide-nucleotide adenylyltransferase
MKTEGETLNKAETLQKPGKPALYIGRFQLFHKGHLDVMRYISEADDISSIVIGIGSSQFDHTNKSPKWPWANNPFTYEERKEMVIGSIEGIITKPYSIDPVPDYFDYPKWYNHIVENLPPFGCLYTSSGSEKEFFEGKGHEVRGFPTHFDFHAQILRERIYKGSQDYRAALTDGTLEVYDRICGTERIKELFARDFAQSLRSGRQNNG